MLGVLYLFSILLVNYSLLAPLTGFLTGAMFAAVSLLYTSFVKDINHMNFYFTGFISPMFFFSGVVFPVSNLPEIIRPVAELLPLTHSVRLIRALCGGESDPRLILDLVYCLLFIFIIGFIAIQRLKKRMLK